MTVDGPPSEWKYYLVYLDEISIFLQADLQHTEHTWLGIGLFRELVETVKLNKYLLVKEKVDYLRDITRIDQLQVASQINDAICNPKAPTTQTLLFPFISCVKCSTALFAKSTRIEPWLIEKLL